MKKLGSEKLTAVLEYTQFGNDLFAEFDCFCPSKSFQDSPIAHLMKTKIKLSGYNDNYFFNVVNKESRVHGCSCGRKYEYQWKVSGVEVKSLEMRNE